MCSCMFPHIVQWYKSTVVALEQYTTQSQMDLAHNTNVIDVTLHINFPHGKRESFPKILNALVLFLNLAPRMKLWWYMVD